MKIHTFVTLSVITIPMPASRDPVYPADRQIAAIGILAALSTDGRRWRFVNRAAAIGAGERDETLLTWLGDNLPAPATLIGWQLDGGVVPLLLEAASTAAPLVARDAMARLAEGLSTGVIELSLDHGGSAAPPLSEVAADHGIGMPVRRDEQRLSDWSWGEIEQLRVDAADEALGLWRLFLRKAHVSGLEAEAATDDWLRRRKRIRPVSGGRIGLAGGDEASGRLKKLRLGPQTGDVI